MNTTTVGSLFFFLKEGVSWEKILEKMKISHDDGPVFVNMIPVGGKKFPVISFFDMGVGFFGGESGRLVLVVNLISSDYEEGLTEKIRRLLADFLADSNPEKRENAYSFYSL
ncbi:hypothetical protein HYV44_02085 [Candidatus Microgenomates bacterium]|nr:hypothetical protein [Candidatus Microgenomates bacterium]